MKFYTAAISVLLAAETVYAKPITLVPRKPRASKRGYSRTTRPISDFATEEAVKMEASSSTNSSSSDSVSYSTNWAGAVLIGTGYTSVTGTFTVPTPEVPSSGDSNTEYSASAWVGLDGDTCDTSILQTGIDFNVQNGEVSFDAWYEWYPDYAYTFSGFEVSAGDNITLTATANSTTSGQVVVENLSTGASVSHSFSGQSASLCETNAEWIVEDYEENGSLVALANFGTVTFTDASVIVNGETGGVTGATIIDMRQDGTVLTSCSTSGSSSVSCTYEDSTSGDDSSTGTGGNDSVSSGSTGSSDSTGSTTSASFTSTTSTSTTGFTSSTGTSGFTGWTGTSDFTGSAGSPGGEGGQGGQGFPF